MLRVNKTPLPTGVRLERDSDYREEAVIALLQRDSYNKCYICEDKAPVPLQVDHLVPKSDDPSRRHDWNNLHFCCAHCNGIKSDRYSPILDCCTHDPDEWFDLTILPFPKAQARVQVRKEIDASLSTAIKNTELLIDEVYNSEATPIRRRSCDNLRDRAIQNMRRFQKYAERYFDTEGRYDAAVKAEAECEIRWHISRKAPFSCFIRGLIRSDRCMFREFGHMID